MEELTKERDQLILQNEELKGILSGLSPIKTKRHPKSFHQDTKIRFDAKQYQTAEKKQGSAKSADEEKSQVEENAGFSMEEDRGPHSDNQEKSLSCRVKGSSGINARDS